MAAGLKDTMETMEFRTLFARLKDWTEDDPGSLPDLARSDERMRDLGLRVLKAAGRIQRSEQSGRDLFTGPVDPKFIVEWRDFEARFAAGLLNSGASDAEWNGAFSFEYYEEPDQWEVADFKALMGARFLDEIVRFAQATADNAIVNAESSRWMTMNPKALPLVLRLSFEEFAKSAGEMEDAYQKFRNELVREREQARDESEKSTLGDMLSKLDAEYRGATADDMPIEIAARDALAFWDQLKQRAGLDLRGILRRRALIPFVLFPRHVSARLSGTGLPWIYQYLRQAHDAFVFGTSFAALAMMRSAMEMTLRDHYAAAGSDLSEQIDSAAKRVPQRANAAALHRLRKLTNNILHAAGDRPVDLSGTGKRDLERSIVSLFFVLRALIEGAPRVAFHGMIAREVTVRR